METVRDVLKQFVPFDFPDDLNKPVTVRPATEYTEDMGAVLWLSDFEGPAWGTPSDPEDIGRRQPIVFGLDGDSHIYERFVAV